MLYPLRLAHTNTRNYWRKSDLSSQVALAGKAQAQCTYPTVDSASSSRALHDKGPVPRTENQRGRVSSRLHTIYYSNLPAFLG